MFQQQSLKKVMALLVLALLLGAAFSFLGGSSNAHAATLDARADVVVPNACSTRDVYVSGGEAHWTKCINGSTTVVDGWVEDTRADGQCAEVYAIFNNGATYHTGHVCPKGTVKNFTWSERTDGVSVYLRIVPA